MAQIDLLLNQIIVQGNYSRVKILFVQRHLCSCVKVTATFVSDEIGNRHTLSWRSAEVKLRKWEKMKFHFGLPVLKPFEVSYRDTLTPSTYEASVNTSI